MWLCEFIKQNWVDIRCLKYIQCLSSIFGYTYPPISSMRIHLFSRVFRISSDHVFRGVSRFLSSHQWFHYVVLTPFVSFIVGICPALLSLFSMMVTAMSSILVPSFIHFIDFCRNRLFKIVLCSVELLWVYGLHLP